MNVQLDLFQWSDSRPSSVINACAKFDRRAVDLAFALDAGRVPKIDGKVIYLCAHRKLINERSVIDHTAVLLPDTPAEGFR